MTKRRLTKVAKEASLHAGQYAFAGRRKKKSYFRRLWITRISHALETTGISYSNFIAKLKQSKIELDRKIMADLIVSDARAFQSIIDKVKES